MTTICILLLSDKKYSQMIFNKKIIALFIISLSLFVIVSSGVFDKISNDISVMLFNWLGYTNKWSRTFGPSWFVNLNDNLSSFGSKEVVLIFSLIFFSYLVLNNKKNYAIEFLLMIFSSVIFIITIKVMISGMDSFSLSKLYSDTLGNYPSGHTFISTVLYITIAFYLAKNENYYKLKYFYFISAVFLILITGIARILGAQHTLTDVIGGWTLGVCWLTFLRMISLKINEKA